MTNRVVARVQKLKAGVFTASHEHNKRLVSVPNADPNGRCETPFERYPGLDLHQAVAKRIEETGAKVVKTGPNETVQAVEVLLSATPTYFRENPDAYGVFDEKKTKAWIDANVKFLKKEYGDNLLSIEVHLDEKTPHIHAFFTPITTKEVKKRRTKAQIAANEPSKTYTKSVFDAKNMLDRKGLSRFQDVSAQAVKHLGIHRGIKNIRSTYKTVAEFHEMIEEVAKSAKALTRLDKADFKLDAKRSLESGGTYTSREQKRLNGYLKSAWARMNIKMKKIYTAYKGMRHKYEVERARTERFANACGCDVETLDSKLTDFETMLYSKDITIEGLKQQLTAANTKIDTLETISDEDRLTYKINKVKALQSPKSKSTEAPVY